MAKMDVSVVHDTRPFAQVSEWGRAGVTQALRTLAATLPPAGSNIVIVTHKPNIMDAFGKDWFDVREGEASVFKPDGGGYKLVVRVPAEEWPKLAQTAPD